MSVKLQIGSDIFEIPVNGQNPGWGEDTTGWMEAVTTVLGSIEGANDIANTQSNLQNDISVFTDILKLNFNTSTVAEVEIDYFIKRIYNLGTSFLVESGKMTGNFDGASFNITRETIGDAEIEIDVTSLGQFQYKSSNLTNHVSSIIKFRAKTIDI